VEDANMLAGWRERYTNDITERTKMRWWRRMLKKMRENVKGARSRSRERKQRGKTAARLPVSGG